MAGQPEIKPHDLRHAFATRLMEKGVSISVIQELLGHADLGTTQIYISVTGAYLEDAIHTLDHNAIDKESDIPKSSQSGKDDHTDSADTTREVTTPIDDTKLPTNPQAKSAGSSVLPYQETPHKLKMREVARTLRA